MQLNAGELRERIVPLFEENFQKFGELGAAVSVRQHGKSIVDLYGGFRDARRAVPWSDDTLVLIWSATKGLGSACVLHVLQERKIDIEQRVAEFWPDFAMVKTLKRASGCTSVANVPSEPITRICRTWSA